MISIEHSEYLIFLANYFKVDPYTILQKSIANNIISPSDSSEVISPTLQSLIGYQRRLLEPLSVALLKILLLIPLLSFIRLFLSINIIPSLLLMRPIFSSFFISKKIQLKLFLSTNMILLKLIPVLSKFVFSF